MINTLKIYEELSETMDSKAARKIVELMSNMYEDLKNTVTKTEFNELQKVVQELAVKIGDLSVSVKELAEAQKRTENRIDKLEQTMAELAEAQKRTENRIDKLEQTMAELAEAQKRTENRIDKLDQTMAELAEAQKRTEKALEELVRDHGKTKVKLDSLGKQVGGLGQEFGFNLEDNAYKALPPLLKRDYNIVLRDRLIRDFLCDDKGREFEVNIYGKARQGEKDIVIIGESKRKLSENDIKDFIRKRVDIFRPVFKEEIFPLLVTRAVTSSKVKKYAADNGIIIYYSYDF